MRIGLFGGTFDPVHIGHVRAARAFAEQAGLDMLHVVPAYINPFKTTVCADADERLHMLELAFAGDEKVIVDDFELRSPMPSFTFLTVQHLMQQYRTSDICLLIGDDNLEQLATWREFDTVLKHCHIYVSSRNRLDIGERINAFNEKYGTDAAVLDFEATVISASQLRKSIDKEMLPDGVYEYITENRLYAVPSREFIINILQKTLSEHRLTHTLGVEKTALLLTERHAPQLDRRLVSASALLHDCTKEYDESRQAAILAECDGVDTDFLMRHPQLCHAVTGAVVAARDFGLCDAGCSAVRWHTTGRAGMNDLEKIIFIADFIEENRRHAACIEVRNAYEAAYARGDADALEAAIQLSIEKVIDMLTKRGEEIDITSKETLQWIKNERKKMNTSADISVLIARAAKKAFEEKQGIDVTVLSVTAQTPLADYFVICSAGSAAQLKALADHAEYIIFNELGLHPGRTEGSDGSAWILMDFGSVVLHIFTREGREFYKLEKLWKDADAVVADI